MKRPGLNKFLIEMGNYYEIVVFGDEDSAVSGIYIILIIKYNSSLMIYALN